MKINIDDLTTVNLSIDPVAKLFFYKNRVLRAIQPEFTSHVNNIIHSSLLTELISSNYFPKTWISDIEIDGYTLILEHEMIIHWNYPYEWSFEMLKDVALFILDINKIANRYGYELQDPHPYNVIFNMNQPQYIDFGSFVTKKQSKWSGYNLYLNYVYTPLYFWSCGYPTIAKNIFLMADIFPEKEYFRFRYAFFALFGNRFFSHMYKVYYSIKIVVLSSDAKLKEKIQSPFLYFIAFLIKKIFNNQFSIKKLINEIKIFKYKSGTSMWSNYQADIDIQNNERFMKISAYINQLSDAHSLLELASNHGKFASYIYDNSHIKKIIATDYDNTAVDIMYLNNKSKQGFLPLLFDMIRTNGRIEDQPICNRIKCDIVIALAVTHHLILTQDIPIDYIFNTLKNLSHKYVIVEFMPIGLYAGEVEYVPQLPKYYNVIWFKEKFENYFDLFHDEQLEINRHIFIGTIKADCNETTH